MSLLIPKNAEGTYGKRLRQYERRLRTILWVGAGLIGMAGLATSDLTDGAPKEFVPIVVTLILAGGGAFAIARIQFEWKATTLEREIHDADAAKKPDAPSKADDPLSADDKHKWPQFGEFFYRAEILIVLCAGVVYLVAVWWAALGAPNHIRLHCSEAGLRSPAVTRCDQDIY